MPTNRRDFLKTSAAAAAAAVTAPSLLRASISPISEPGTAFANELAAEALNAARDAGATYADVRIGR
jgi:TldD protein